MRRSRASGSPAFRSDVQLVHERGGLERVPFALASEMPLGDRAQGIVDEPHEAIARLRLSSVPLAQELRYIGHLDGRIVTGSARSFLTQRHKGTEALSLCPLSY